MTSDILIAFVCTVHTEMHVSLLHLEEMVWRSDKTECKDLTHLAPFEIRTNLRSFFPFKNYSSPLEPCHNTENITAA